MRDFEYFEPMSIAETLSLLSRYGEQGRVIAGGTNLIPQMQRKEISPQYVVSIGRIPDLDRISYDATQGLKIGTLATIRAIEKSPQLRERHRILCDAAHQLGSPVVRNMATIGGNLCNASPAADMAPALIGLSSTVRIIGPAGEREMLLEDFFVSPGRTALGTDELLLEVRIPPLPPNTVGAYLKFSRRGAMETEGVGIATEGAIVGVVAVITVQNTTCTDAKLVLGAVGPKPMRALKAEQMLRGKQIDDTLIEEVARAASEEARPRRRPEFKRQMVRVFTGRAIRVALEQAKQEPLGLRKE